MIHRAELVAHRVFDDDVCAWLSRGFRAWLAADGAVPLVRCLRLPASARTLRRQMRDKWLGEAAGALPDGLTAWQRACVLAAAAHAFQARKWPTWRRLSAPPAEATPAEVALWYARRAAPLPTTPQGFAKLLTISPRKVSGAARTMEPHATLRGKDDGNDLDASA